MTVLSTYNAKAPRRGLRPVEPTGVQLNATEEALREAGTSFAVIGGVAVSARVSPRFTQDIDFSVAVDNDDQARSGARTLIQRGYRASMEPEVVESAETVEVLTGTLVPTARIPHLIAMIYET